MLGRRAKLEIIYNNQNVTENLEPHLNGWTFTDNLSGQSDDIQLTLEDREQLWAGPWMPQKGAWIKAAIIRTNWEQEKAERFPIGSFEADEIEISGPPATAALKALSAPESSSVKGEDSNRAWEKTTLKVIAGDIAKKNGLKLFYDTEDNPDFDRMEQSGEADLAFLLRLCSDAGLCLKVANKRIVIFDEEKYEKQVPIDTIKKGASYIKDYRGRTTMNGTYGSCQVEYHDAEKKKKIKHTYTPDKKSKTGRVLKINERVKSTKEAERLSKKRLREKNKEATTFSITMMGDPRYLAGVTVNLSGFGKFDGKYIVTQAAHSQQQGGYDTKLELRKCLEGY